MLILATYHQATFGPIIQRATVTTTISPQSALRLAFSKISAWNTSPLSTAEVSKTWFHKITKTMGKKKTAGEYNDFLDGEKLRDNAEIRNSLQASSSTTRGISSPPARQDQGGSKLKGTGGSRSPPLTHFLCFPLITKESKSQLQQGLEKLKAELGNEDLVPTKAVRPIGTLHLTLGVMSIDDSRLREAKQFLQTLDLQRLLHNISMQGLAEKAAEDGAIAENLTAAVIPETDALTVNLQSLVPMQVPQRTSILYAEPRDASQRLVPFASTLRELFMQEGFLIEDTRSLKLHATIVNTVYAKSSRRGEGHGPNSKSWMWFDARELIEKYKEFLWAEDVRVDRVQICRMGAKKIWSGANDGEGEILDERYEVVCEKSIYE